MINHHGLYSWRWRRRLKQACVLVAWMESPLVLIQHSCSRSTFLLFKSFCPFFSLGPTFKFILFSFFLTWFFRFFTSWMEPKNWSLQTGLEVLRFKLLKAKSYSQILCQGSDWCSNSWKQKSCFEILNQGSGRGTEPKHILHLGSACDQRQGEHIHCQLPRKTFWYCCHCWKQCENLLHFAIRIHFRGGQLLCISEVTLKAGDPQCQQHVKTGVSFCNARLFK